ncbi:hypothetical protein C7S20_14160 [Christiangramia fulva]|uniref:Uncharacterized protein n=1 Tax=Christiangramia fulva TaxID=2126553 RepID=A0A2R3Z7V0_9FLAO|nr:hypothetical protein [Christiangramia fulva]AVR46315.1 hypothetical protein C7S20_14160 [Christiangramia fulva]
MKKLIILVWILGFVSVSYSQKVIQLQEAKVTYEPSAKVLYEKYDNGNVVLKLQEAYVQQFRNDPVKFLINNFDMQAYLNEYNSMNNNLDVTIKSKSGYLKANYNKYGELVQTSQKFKNVLLPREIWNDVFASHRGWTMTKNVYTARGKGSAIDAQSYIITMKNGKMQKKLKINPVKKTSIVAVR